MSAWSAETVERRCRPTVQRLRRVGQQIPMLVHDPNAIRVVRLVISVPFAEAGLSTKRRRRDALFP
jgi:hypothetical protein